MGRWNCNNEAGATIRGVRRVEGVAAIAEADGMGEEGQAQRALARTRWWHFYGLLNRDGFERELTQDVARFFAGWGGDSSQWQRLQARLEALAKLRLGSVVWVDL